ncbi:hypothetical protein CSPAE12_10646 [Colletotrichum incanum]|nr:hypothetical protein CSPAE12_10646 [Colletotrichum incanum]
MYNTDASLAMSSTDTSRILCAKPTGQLGISAGQHVTNEHVKGYPRCRVVSQGRPRSPTHTTSNGLSFLQQDLQASSTKVKTINSPDSPGQINSFNQTNPEQSKTVFPQADTGDPSFQKTDFVKGNNPVLLVPGTGVNVPLAMLDDI